MAVRLRRWWAALSALALILAPLPAASFSTAEEVVCWDYEPQRVGWARAGLAQTFVADADGPLVAFDVFVGRQPWTTQDLVFEVRDAGPSGPLLATSDPLPASWLDSGSWRHVMLSNPPALRAGQAVSVGTVVPYPLTDGDPSAPCWLWYWDFDSADAETTAHLGTADPGSPDPFWDPYYDGSDLLLRPWIVGGSPSPHGDLFLYHSDAGGPSVLMVQPPFEATLSLDPAEGWSWPRSRLVAGDVDGDSDADVVIPHEQPGGGMLVWVSERQEPSLFGRPVVAQDLRGGGWSFPGSRQLLADVDADGDQDLISIHAQSGSDGFLAWVHQGDGAGGFSAPAVWAGLSGGGWSFERSRQVAGDVTGDGRADLVSVHAQAGSDAMLIWVHPALTQGGFGAPQVWQGLVGGGWSFSGSRQLLADVDGDRLADLVSVHAQAGNPGMLLWVHPSNPGGRFDAPQVAQRLLDGGWSFLRSRQGALDVTDDGAVDLVSVHADSGTGGFRIWVHEAGAFGSPWLWDTDYASGTKVTFNSSRFVVGLEGDGHVAPAGGT